MSDRSDTCSELLRKPDDGDSTSGLDRNIHYQSTVTSFHEEEDPLSVKPDDAFPLAYATPAEILAAFNVDQRTVADVHLSESSQDSDIPHEIERTLAMIKPSCVEFAREIERRIYNEGFSILQKRKIHLSPEQASEFYYALYGTLDFPSLIVYMSSSPVLVYCLAGIKAISHWRKVIGPTSTREAEMYWPLSLRAIYGKYDTMTNAVHGSSDLESADREIRFFFPEMIMEPLQVEQMAIDYLNIVINPLLAKGLAELSRVKPVDPLLWLGDWLLLNNPNRPRLPENVTRTTT